MEIFARSVYTRKRIEKINNFEGRSLFRNKLEFSKEECEYVYVLCVCVSFVLFNIAYVDINVYLRQFLYKGNEKALEMSFIQFVRISVLRLK